MVDYNREKKIVTDIQKYKKDWKATEKEYKARKKEANVKKRKKFDPRAFAKKYFRNPSEEFGIEPAHGFGPGKKTYCHSCQSFINKSVSKIINEKWVTMCSRCGSYNTEEFTRRDKK